MAFPTFPTQPDPWPVRTQAQEDFDIAVAGTFNFYDGLETWAAGFESEANTLAGALVAANLPSLTGQAGKVPFVVPAGNAVEMAAPSFVESVGAVDLGKVGDFNTSTLASAVSDTITLDVGKFYTLILLAFSKYRATAVSDNNYFTEIQYDGASQSLSQASGSFQVSGEVDNFMTFSVARVAGAGAVSIDLMSRCHTNCELDRAHLAALVMRTS